MINQMYKTMPMCGEIRTDGGDTEIKEKIGISRSGIFFFLILITEGHQSV